MARAHNFPMHDETVRLQGLVLEIIHGSGGYGGPKTLADWHKAHHLDAIGVTLGMLHNWVAPRNQTYSSVIRMELEKIGLFADPYGALKARAAGRRAEECRIIAEELYKTAAELAKQGKKFPETVAGWFARSGLARLGITQRRLGEYAVGVKCHAPPSSREWKRLAWMGLIGRGFVANTTLKRLLRMLLPSCRHEGISTVGGFFDAHRAIFEKYGVSRKRLLAMAFGGEFCPLFEAKGIHIGRGEGRSGKSMENYWAGLKERRVAHLFRLLAEFPPVKELKKWCEKYKDTEVEIEIGGRKEKNTFSKLKLGIKAIRSLIEEKSPVRAEGLREQFIARGVMVDGRKLAGHKKAWAREAYLLRGKVVEAALRLPHEGGAGQEEWRGNSIGKKVLGLSMGKLKVDSKLLGRILNDRKNFPYIQETYGNMAKRAGEAKSLRHRGRKNSPENHFPFSVAEQYCRCLSLLARWQYGKKAGGKWAPNAGQSRPAGMQNTPPEAHADRPADAIAAEKPSFASFFRMSGERLSQICTTQDSIAALAFKTAAGHAKSGGAAVFKPSKTYSKKVADALGSMGFDVAREEKLWQVGIIVEGALKDNRWANKDENYIKDFVQFVIGPRIQIGIGSNEDFLGYALDKNCAARKKLEECGFVDSVGNLRERINPVQKKDEGKIEKKDMRADAKPPVSTKTNKPDLNMSPMEKWGERVQAFNNS